MKEPIGKFIIQQRMQKAGYLLALTKLPVAEIRLLVGYDNDTAFSRSFKKTMVFHQSHTDIAIANQTELATRYICIAKRLR